MKWAQKHTWGRPKQTSKRQPHVDCCVLIGEIERGPTHTVNFLLLKSFKGVLYLRKRGVRDPLNNTSGQRCL
jgi:hypothetical protein